MTAPTELETVARAIRNATCETPTYPFTVWDQGEAEANIREWCIYAARAANGAGHLVRQRGLPVHQDRLGGEGVVALLQAQVDGPVEVRVLVVRRLPEGPWPAGSRRAVGEGPQSWEYASWSCVRSKDKPSLINLNTSQ